LHRVRPAPAAAAARASASAGFPSRRSCPCAFVSMSEPDTLSNSSAGTMQKPPRTPRQMTAVGEDEGAGADAGDAPCALQAAREEAAQALGRRCDIERAGDGQRVV